MTQVSDTGQKNVKDEVIEDFTQPSVADEVENRQKWVQKNLFSRVGEKCQPYKDISHDFKGYKDWKPPQFSTVVWKKNADKNRYADQMCMDQTRVVLKDRGADNDYINASWMSMPDGRRWISTQGPIKTTLEDFWHMVYSENVKVICMLCGFKENDVEKAREYFNVEGRKVETYGIYKVRVKTKSSEVFPTIKMTVLEVEKKNGKSSTVTHLWHTNWEDHFCPLDPSPCICMLKLAIEKSANSPIVAHCSAGIGRTATFVGIDYAFQKIGSEPEIKMSEVFLNLRKMRLRAIQSQLQYAFLHQCLAEYCVQQGCIQRDEKFEKLKACFELMVKRIIKQQSAAKDAFYAKKTESNRKREKEQGAETAPAKVPNSRKTKKN